MILYPVKKKNGATIGGKAEGLIKLVEAGINVPDFLILPAENFTSLIQQPSIGAADIKERLLQFALTDEDQKQLTKILAGWGFPHQSVIVRSSIVDEDGSQNAFAGIMSSYSNLRNIKDVHQSIAQCAASAYSSEAIAYRAHRSLSSAAQPAVIVQKQLNADSSGVVFSTYPQYPEEMAVHAVWGLGEGLVDGKLDADEFYLLKKDGSITHQTIAFKDKQFKPDPQKGSQLMDIDRTKQNTPCITQTQLQSLFAISKRLEKRNGHPQDIEFVITDNELYFVQSRHITQTIPQVIVYDNSNIQESYCGVTTPLTFSFAQRVYTTVYQQTMILLSVPEKVAETYRPVLDNLLGLVKGRIYYNINNWYRGLQVLPSFKQNKEDMERMMGLEDPVDFISDTKKSFTEKLKLMPTLLSSMSRLLLAFRKLDKDVATFHSHFSTYYEHFYQSLPTWTNGSQIVEQIRALDEALLKNWTTPIVNDFYVMMMNGKVRRKLIKAGIREPEEFLSMYLAGNQQIESAQPAVVMQKIALEAMLLPELKALIIKLPSGVHELIKIQFPDFYTTVNSFIHTYGDRTVGELKLETVTMRLSPRIFYSYLRNYLTTENTFQTSALSHLHESARKKLDSMLQKRSYLFKRGLYSSLHKLRKGIQYREGMRLERTRLFGMYRALYLKAGDLLVRANALPLPEDIFYLTEPEIWDLLLNKTTLQKATAIAERKETFDGYKREEVSARVIVPAPREKLVEVSNNDPYILQGTGCVPGEVTAEVMIIRGPEDDLDVSGKIVCALRTDPGWVALFPTCKAVLIEKGSALSHSVILLREFGIPAIINIPGLTNKLKSGQRVSMNGTSGVIKIIKDEPN
ncbi:MAG TPA: PEP/pyruvate-binding domain-containing protein [Pedobacter sp.]|uniref:PEP/pyruvate-binding domain-containing protein n=1 Tax=Pedobacter sp. TaxID=1411316 RepID=UPI002D15C20D|nr:PEP/pyruvate-binding domain-containing protein [Pedobacter sp.]HMI04702.1 PEP/pyruvate-binding domain-containing protein [Pedobacter sp.]